MDKGKTIRIRISPEEIFKTLLEPKGVMVEKPFFVMDPFYYDWDPVNKVKTTPSQILDNPVKNELNVVTKNYTLLDSDAIEWDLSFLFFTEIRYWYDELPDRETAHEMSVSEDTKTILIDVGPDEIYEKLIEPKGIRKNVKYNFYHPDGSEWGFNPSYLNEDFELVDSSGTANDDLSLLFEADIEPIG